MYAVVGLTDIFPWGIHEIYAWGVRNAPLGKYVLRLVSAPAVSVAVTLRKASPVLSSVLLIILIASADSVTDMPILRLVSPATVVGLLTRREVSALAFWLPGTSDAQISGFTDSVPIGIQLAQICGVISIFPIGSQEI